jgi:glycosyltransferase involved in cell wall biosynthesis
MSRSLRITTLKDRYPTSFCTPKNSRHLITSRYFIPTHRVSKKIESFTVIMPNMDDLIHSVNRIPVLTSTPYVISFESHLPRYYGGEQTRLFAAMRRRLASAQCRRIIAYSENAKRAFLATHCGADEVAELAGKLEVIYPNLTLPEWAPVHHSSPVLSLVFIGAHFGRKGGAVAVRAAEIARRRNLPMHFHIISSLIIGPTVWTDPRDVAFFEPYLKLLHADNVTFDRALPNDRVIDILRSADFSILATLSDTFGFSAVESLSVGTPVLATPQGALPEFIVDGENGLMLQLPTDTYGEWIHVGRSDKDSRRFEALYRHEIERLAEQLISRVEPFCIDRIALEQMRHRSRQTAERHFDSNNISLRLDQLYNDSVR